MAEDLRAAPSGGVLRARPGAPRTATDDQSIAPAPVAAAGNPRSLGLREVVAAAGGAASTTTSIPIDPQTSAIASEIAAAIPEALWRQYTSHRLPLDLLLYTETEVSQRQQYRSAVTSLAYQEGILLNGRSGCPALAPDRPS